MLQVDPDPRPGGVPPAHRIHQHIRRLQMFGCLWMLRLPPFQPRHCGLFLFGQPDLDQRKFRYPPL
jgi:hypothetical protein